MPQKTHREKTINLALQGGGAHGAFTWGVLDRILEDDRIRIGGISGTSAGAMNAVVVAQGLHEDGANGAREALRHFWQAVSAAGEATPLQRNPINILFGDWSLDNSPSYMFLDLMQRLTSPYETNPLDINPLRDLLARCVDFDNVRACKHTELYISATNVETGRVRVFTHEETTLDVVMASACLPQIFQAVEIDGKAYWDGGYMGNPVLFPFYDFRHANDVVIVQINPVVRPGIPRTATEIQNRVNEITFNSSLLKEMRSIDFITRMIEEGKLEATGLKPLYLHIIEACEQMAPLGASSKVNTEWRFLLHLHEIGHSAADRWLAEHYDDLGVRPGVDIRAMCGEIGASQQK